MKIGGTNLTNGQELNYQCIGCGAMIQWEDPDRAGYLPESAFKKGIEEDSFYCQRCFRLRHYNELHPVEVSEEVFRDHLSSLADEEALVVKVVDIFDVEGSLISSFSRIIGKQPFVVVANKMDLLPKSVKANRVKHWLKECLRENGLIASEILLLSAHKEPTLHPLFDLIKTALKTKNVYLVGVTNVGKSTLMNQLIRHFGGEQGVITTSNHPGTTLDKIVIPVTDQTAIIDTPGIIQSHQLAHYLDRRGVKNILPSKRIKPKTFQLNPKQTLFLAGLAQIDFLAGVKTSFTCYVSNDLYLHRGKLTGASDFFSKHQGDLLAPPYNDQRIEFPEMIAHSVFLEPNQDLAISGLGWICVNQKVQLKVWIPKGIHFSIRQALI